MEDLAITLSTLSGASHCFNVPSHAAVAEGKLQIAEQLGRPAELQRWLSNGAILEDSDLLANCQEQGSKRALDILCVFLPRTFDVLIKVVKFSPGSQAQNSKEVSISVSPMMPIDAAKFEALSAASASLGAGSVDVAKVARLIKGGLNLLDEKTIEYYHIDPDTKLHLIIPRDRKSEPSSPGNVSEELNEHYAPADDNAKEAGRDVLADKKRKEADMFRECNKNKDDITKNVEYGEKRKDGLSPRTQAAASMFGTMGVHRLRPRRSSSVPVLQPRSASVRDSSARADSLNCVQASIEAEKSNSLETASAPCRGRPQKPSEAKATALRPLRRPSRAGCHLSAAVPILDSKSVCKDNAQASEAAASPTRPVKASVGVARPPAVPRAPTATKETKGTRPSASRGQRKAQTVATIPSNQQSSTETWMQTPLMWDWATQAPASVYGGLEHAAITRSSSCRPEHIDRWHFVARLH